MTRVVLVLPSQVIHDDVAQLLALNGNGNVAGCLKHSSRNFLELGGECSKQAGIDHSALDGLD